MRLLYASVFRKRIPLWCRRPESNRHGPFGPRDFKSRASTNFATPAGQAMLTKKGSEAAGLAPFGSPKTAVLVVSEGRWARRTWRRTCRAFRRARTRWSRPKLCHQSALFQSIVTHHFPNGFQAFPSLSLSTKTSLVFLGPEPGARLRRELPLKSMRKRFESDVPSRMSRRLFAAESLYQSLAVPLRCPAILVAIRTDGTRHTVSAGWRVGLEVSVRGIPRSLALLKPLEPPFTLSSSPEPITLLLKVTSARRSNFVPTSSLFFKPIQSSAG